jgi:hypothetical protein
MNLNLQKLALAHVIATFFCQLSFGQTFVEGVVINKFTKAVVPYASVVFLTTKTGVATDANGMFRIAVIDSNDSLLISSVGYETLKTIPQKKQEFGEFELVPKISVNPGVLIQQAIHSTTLNKNNKNNKVFYYTTTNKFSYELAQHFVSPTNEATISQISWQQIDKKSVFRIKIYDLDTLTYSPGKVLNSSIIEVKTKKSWVKINTEKYNIVVPCKDFFVAVEWQPVPYNEEKGYIKMGENRQLVINYKPSIPASDHPRSSEIPQVWEMLEPGKWSPILTPPAVEKRLNIEVIVKHP